MDNLYKTLKTAIELIVGVFALILIVAIPVGSMFGIASLVDNISSWFVLLFIPWFLALCFWVACSEKKTNDTKEG